MTQGSIVKNIIIFALPLLAGNLFQQLYNMVDTWVIGQTGENGAYAAVGSVGPITNILIGFFMGLSTGSSVVIAQYYGAKNEEGVKKASHTSVAMTLIMGILFTVIGLLMTPLLVSLMFRDNVSVAGYAKTYVLIYFLGTLPNMIYNIGSGILRAIGDSSRPFYFLTAAMLSNVVLDLLFVFVFKMGVAGVALATILSQTISAVLVTITLLKTDTWIKIEIKDLKIDWNLFGKIFKIGIPAGIQLALTAFSNVFVQSYIAGINVIPGITETGKDISTIALAGWTSYSKIDMFIFLPMQSIALAATTFVGQNIGCGNIKRAKQGAWTSFLLTLGITCVLIFSIEIFTSPITSIFNPDPDVVHCSVILLQTLTPFYVFCCVNQVLSASLRGAGNTIAPTLAMLGAFVGFRQLYLFIISTYVSKALIPIAMSYPAGWFMCSIIVLTTFFLYDFSKGKLTK